MNKIRTIGSIVLMGCLGLANAQSDDGTQEVQTTEHKQPALTDSTTATFELRVDPQPIESELNKKVLKNEIGDQSITITVDTKNYILSIEVDTVRVDKAHLQDHLAKRGYYLILSEDAQEDEIEIIEPQEPAEKYAPEIDRFLNIEDTTIFTSKFVQYDSLEIHPSRWNYYQTIQIIHDFGEQLDSCTYKLSDSARIERFTQKGSSLDAAKAALMKEAKQHLVAAEKRLDALLPFGGELSVLSTTQKQYYKDLKNIFYELYAKISPD